MNRRLPDWLRSELPTAKALARINQLTYSKGITTVCKEARCPNQGECFERGTATFMILGDTCTRNCAFCAVSHGAPRELIPDEPHLVASAVQSLGLRHAVVTSVTRDDLPDGGASVFAETIEAIRKKCPNTIIEVLIPDFQGSENALLHVLQARPHVLNHNLETIERLYPVLRREASYQRSLDLLRSAHKMAPEIPTKSGIMVGVGETFDEVRDLVKDLVQASCLTLTIGQYLRPTRYNHSVERYVPPDEFSELETMARAEGMVSVSAGPLVRSSYRAGDVYHSLKQKVCDR